MKKVFSVLLFMLLFLPKLAFADSIESIDVHAKILDDGSINVTQTWHATPTQGTEFYIPMQHLNHMELTNFTVSDENGPYTLVEPWNVDASFEEKSNKYGINKTDDGIELCFGKSELKAKTYTLNYTFKNAVIGYIDADAFNIRFINDQMDPSPENVSVTIEKEGLPLSQDNAKIWAFGYLGDINFEDGNVVAKNNESFNSSNHVTIMLALNKGLINPSYTLNESFDNLKSTAFEGSDYENSYNDLDGTPSSAIERENNFPFGYILGFIAFIFFLIFGIAINANDPIANNIDNVDRKNPKYYRDIPFNGYLPAIYYIRQNQSDNLDGIISSQLLKWIGEGCIAIETHDNEGMIKKFFKPKETTLRILGTPKLDNKFEKTLFEYIINAKGDDDILTDKEFKRYLSNETDFPEEFSDTIIKIGRKFLIDNGYLANDEKKKERYMLTQLGLDETSNMYAFGRFLDDFTLISEREPIEVALWDNILIMATMLNKGEEVIKSFEKFYPNYRFGNDSNPVNMYYNYYYMRSFSNHSYNSVIQSAASSGLGGSSSFGGGGGFSGGGSGGGGR